jgi:DNA-binding CsgD family transcriptional regulator
MPYDLRDVRRDEDEWFAPLAPSLSLRESQLVGFVSNGMTNREIADQLFLGEETVKTYMKSTLLKFGAKNRAHMVALAFRCGLLIVETPEP